MAMELSNSDEVELLEGLKSLGDCLERVGVEGVATVTFSSNGDITGCFAVNTDTHLTVSIENDRRRKTVEYEYV